MSDFYRGAQDKTMPLLARWSGKKDAVESGPQRAAGALADLGDDPRRDRLDLLVGHGLLARLQRDRDGDRLPARRDALALVDVEHRHVGDELAVGGLGGAHQVAGPDGAVDHEGKIALDRLERRELPSPLAA